MTDLYWSESSGIMQPGLSGCNAEKHRKGGQIWAYSQTDSRS